jgi:hypothetical protein
MIAILYQSLMYQYVKGPTNRNIIWLEIDLLL